MKSEIRIIQNNSPAGNFHNGNFQYYALYWSGITNTQSNQNFLPLTPTGQQGTLPTYTQIELPSGWTWNNRVMYSENGSDLPMYQPISGLTEGYYYRTQFTVIGADGTGGLTAYLYGQSGDTVYNDGQYVQYIYIPTGSTPTFDSGQTIMFQPQSNFIGGVTNVSLNPSAPLQPGGGAYIQPVSPTVSSYKVLDLYDDDESFALTFQIQTNISNKSAAFSKTIKVPGTSNNNAIFMNNSDIGKYLNLTEVANTSSIWLNKKLQAGIYIDSVEILYGFLELDKVIRKDGAVAEYECVFYSNIKSLADTLGDKLICGNENTDEDLDFHDYNHLHTWDYIKSTWVTGTTVTGYTMSKGIYYPVIDYANIGIGYRYRMENFKPSLYIKEIWDRIFSDNGFSYTSTFLNSNVFKSLITPQTGTAVEYGLDFERKKFKVGRESVITSTGPANGSWSPWMTINFTKQSGGTFYNNEYTYNTGGTYAGSWPVTSSMVCNLFSTIKYTLWLDPSESGSANGGSNFQVEMRIIRKRGGVEYVAGNVDTKTYTLQTGWVILDMGMWAFLDDLSTMNAAGDKGSQITMNDANCYTGDQVYIQYRIKSNIIVNKQGGGTIPCSYTFTILNSDETTGKVPTLFQNDPVKKNYYLEGTKVYGNDALPRKMKQIDFIKSISNKFNLMFVEDKAVTNNFYIEPYDTFFSSGTTLDWSTKVDLSKDYYFERIPYLLNKDVAFKFKDDGSDYLLKLYKDSTDSNFGDRYITNVHYTDSTETVSDSFSSTFLGGLGNTNWTISKIYKQQDNYYTQLPTDGEFNYRVLYRSLIGPQNCSGRTFTSVTVEDYDLNWSGQTNSGNTLKILGTICATTGQSYPYAGFLDNPFYPTLDLNYGRAVYYSHQGLTQTDNRLSWVYWRNKLSNYLDVNGKQLTCYMFLNQSDIAKLDFRNYILIDNHKYALTKISDWTPYGSSKVTLQQILPSNVDAYLDEGATLLYAPGPTGGGGTTGTGPGGTIGGGGVGGGGGGNALPDGMIILTPPNAEPTYYYGTDSGATLIEEGEVASTYDGWGHTDLMNYYPQNAAGIIIGTGNVISDTSTFVKGNNNIITSVNNTLIDSNNNQVNSDGLVLIKSHNNIVLSGLTASGTTSTDGVILIKSDNNIIDSSVTKGMLIQTTGITLTSDNKVYIQNRAVDTLTDVEYVSVVSGQTLTDSMAYTDTKSGDTLTYVDNNYYDKTIADSTFSTKGGVFNNTIKTTRTYNSNGDYVIGDNYNGTGRTITLMDADKIDGKVFLIHDLYGNANVNNIDVYQEGGGLPWTSMTSAGRVLFIYSDGSNWYHT